MKLTDEQIKYMVNRFLGWKLPKTFNPDGGVKFEPVINTGTTYEHRYNPSGTNILCYSQAEEMVNFMLDGMPEQTPAPTAVDLDGLKRDLLPTVCLTKKHSDIVSLIVDELSSQYDFVRKV